MIVPSEQENLANTVIESLACGTPVVGFDIGGNKDMILHKENGYLANPFEPTDLASGIDWILQNDTPEILSQNSRNSVLKKYTMKDIAQKHLGVYKDLIKSYEE